MKEPRKHTLSEAVAGMVSMIIEIMLGLLRARGLRGLLELPAYFRLALELRRMGEDFTALFEAFKAGTLPPPPPEPVDSWPLQESACPRAPAKPSASVRARAPSHAAHPRRRALPCALAPPPAPPSRIARAPRSRAFCADPPAHPRPLRHRARSPPLSVVPTPGRQKNPRPASGPSHAKMITL
jgi:hypothetical protein